MQSKTSCFNSTLFRKHITRFWPVWGVYLAIWLLELPVSLLSRRTSLLLDLANSRISVQQTALNSIYSGVALSFIFSVLMAMAVWSFLYSARSASGAACLPVTRTAQFWSAALAGLLPLLAAHVLTFVLTALAELSLGLLHLPSLLTWLGATVLNLLFFYGFATLCAMLTGNIIVLPAVYVVLNFVAAGLVVLLNGIVDWFVYGLNGFDGGWLTWLSPAVQLFANQVSSVTVYDAAQDAWFITGWVYNGWLASAIYAVVGVALLFAALALLRRRKMETAGDVVAVPVLKPVFRWCMGLCAGLCFANMMLYVFNLAGGTQRAVFLSAALWLVIGAFLGWFVAEMLIRKSFRVFRGGWGGWGGWAVCCAVLLLGLTVMELDVLGVEKRVPQADRIESVIILCNGESAFLDDSESVAQAMALHRDVIAHKPQQDQCSNRDFFTQNTAGEYQTVEFHLDYMLTGGGKVTRAYRLPHRVDTLGDDADGLQTLLNCPTAVRNRKETPFEFTEENVSYGSISAVMPARECAALAGYDDPAAYVLAELGGYSPAAQESMTDDRRDTALRDILADACYLDDSFYDGAIYDEYYSEKYGYISRPALPEVGGELDWDRIWLNVTLDLNRQEAWELYHDCVQPDLADNALGRIWVLQGSDYANTVCCASLEIDARWPEDVDDRPKTPTSVEYRPGAAEDSSVRYYGLYTVPTADSARTNAFFEARGLHPYTVAEVRAAQTGAD